MPIYEYRCQECGHELEKIQRMSDAPLTECPACDKPQLKRLVSAAGFRLKGGGWYETDFKQGNRKNLAGSESDSGKSSGGEKGASGGDGSKTDAKSSGSSDGKAGKAAAKSQTAGKNKSASA